MSRASAVLHFAQFECRVSDIFTVDINDCVSDRWIAGGGVEVKQAEGTFLVVPDDKFRSLRIFYQAMSVNIRQT